MKQEEAYNKAAHIAYIAMGKEKGRSGIRKKDLRHNADLDPLAWWCLTELIMTMRKP